jgi:cleavage and polyadenylation specificity factor subunit 3
VLLPIVALGRAQELLLILEDYWARHPDMQHIPVYQASGLARRSLSVYQTYINMLNEDMQSAFEVANPFALKHVKHLAGGGQLDDSGPCVVLATPSMLQTGLSRELFESWAGDARNGVIIADFAVQGTLARDILSDAKTVTTRSGLVVPIKCSVDAISFSAHADFPQTQAFVAELAPPHVVLVHGESVEMGRLKRALEAAAAAAGTPLHVYTPRNCQPVAIAHRGEKVARLLGRLAERAAAAEEEAAAAGGEAASAGVRVSGLLVQKEFSYTLLHPSDLATYTKLRAGALRQRQLVPCAQPFTAVRLALEALFDGIAVVRTAPPLEARVKAEDSGAAAAADEAAAADAAPEAAVKAEAGGAEPAAAAAAAAQPAIPAAPRSPLRAGDALSIDGRLTIAPGTAPGAPHVVFEWLSDPVADMIADAALASVLSLDGPPPGVTAAEAAHTAAAGTSGEEGARWRLFQAMLAAQFGPAQLDEDAGTITLGGGEPAEGEWAEAAVVVSLRSGGVVCEDSGRKERVAKALERIGLAICPLAPPPKPLD